jgi:predicted GNAT family N-acyltransferase
MANKMPQNLNYTFFQLPSPLWQAAFDLRLEVFVREQGVPEDMELDAYDRKAYHLLARDERGDAIATLRIVVKEDEGKIGRVAVVANRRRQGIGAIAMGMALAHCRSLHLTQVTLDSQQYAIPFYERLGFACEGECFMDAGIPHVRMTRKLAPS